MYDAANLPDSLHQAHRELDYVVDDVFGIADHDLPELDRQDVLFDHYRRLTKRR